MQTVRIPFTNFQFGEISPSLIGRTDIEVYNNSAQKLTNFFIRNEGGVIKRPGFKYKVRLDSATGDSGIGTRIVPFIFSDDEKYIIGFTDSSILIMILDFDSSGSASAGAVTHIQTITADVDGANINTYLSATNIKEINYAQSGDVMFLTHETFQTLKLVRTSLLKFEVSKFTFDVRSDAKQRFQPYFGFQPQGYTMTPSGSTGQVTLTVKPSGTLANWASGQSYTVGTLLKDTSINQIYRVSAAHTSSGSEPLSTNANSASYQAIVYFDTTGSKSGANYPSSKHVDLTVRYRGQEIDIDSVQSSTQATGTILNKLFVKLDINALRTINTSNVVEVTMPLHNLSVSDSITIEEADAVGGIAVGNINGSRTVATIVDENRFTFTAGANATSSADGGGAPKIVCNAESGDFDEQSFSALRGFPRAICFHEGRLWFGGSVSQPDSLFGSKTNDFFNFDVGSASDNDSIQITTSIGELSAIKHLVSNRDLQVFTESSEFIVPAFQNTPVTPTNAMIRRQTPYGASHVKPVVFDGATIYLQRSGTVLREFIFSDKEAAYIASSVSTLSGHLIDNPQDMASLQAAINRPESYIFLVNTDGTLAVFNSDRSQKKAGFTQFTWPSSGTFKSVCTVDERTFALVRNNIGTGTEYYFVTELDESVNLDMSVSASVSSGTLTTSNTIFNGATVAIVDGNNYLGTKTIASNGTVSVSDLSGISSTVEIGYAITPTFKTNPLDINTQEGPTTGMLRGLGRVVVDIKDTLSITINSKNLEIRNVTDDPSQARQAITGKKEVRLLGYSRDPQVTISQNDPLSLQINSVIAEVQI